tara:strand:+ start:858 stop:2033 length:1176 start_codon:yes stop_codon:yes gene_type:complete
MRSILCIIILNLILINSTSAKENWTVEKILNDEFISISTFGEVTHGDRYRLLINTKGDCKSAEETFTFYTTANHPKILEIENKKIILKYNEKNKLGDIKSSSKFLAGHSVFISTGLLNIKEHAKSFDNNPKLNIKILAVVRDIQKKTGWNAEEMFDVGFNSWNLKGLSKAIKSAQNMCLNKPKNGIDLKTTVIISLILLFLVMFFILREKKSTSPERKLAEDLVKNIKKSKPKSKTKNEPKDDDVKNSSSLDELKENSKIAGELNHILLGVLRHQLSITVKGLAYISKDKDPLKTLPKDNFVYGYLYGFADYCYQTSRLGKNEESWLFGSLAFFGMIFGPKLGAKICMDSEKLLDNNKEFNEGIKSGSSDARDWKNKKVIAGLSEYINKLN